MKVNTSKIAKYLPLAVGVAIISVGSIFVPWERVVPYLVGISLDTALIVLTLGLVYYFGRILRFWLMLRILDQPTHFDKVAVAYLIAQPMSFLPGGEFYRSVMLKKYGNVSLRDGLPSVFVQSLTESLGLLSIALIGALFLHRYVLIMIVIACLFMVLISFIKWLNTRKSHKLVNTLPKVEVSHGHIRSFLSKNRLLLSGKNFLILYFTSFISTIAGVCVLYVTAREFGAEISLFGAAIAFAVPVILQLVTFIPGGLGVNEQGSVGILALLGVGLAMAVAITIVVRFVTLIFGFILGFMAMAYVKLRGYKEYH